MSATALPRLSMALVSLVVSLGCAHQAPREQAHATAHTSGDDHQATVHHTARADRDDTTAEVVAPPTAMAQSEAPADVEITRHIRAAVVSDGTLSFAAANCTIVTDRAVVTLRGEVATRAERDTIEQHAHAAPGVVRVDDQLHVAD